MMEEISKERKRGLANSIIYPQWCPLSLSLIAQVLLPFIQQKSKRASSIGRDNDRVGVSMACDVTSVAVMATFFTGASIRVRVMIS